MSAASIKKSLTFPAPLHQKILNRAKRERRSFNQAAMLTYEEIFFPKGVPHLKKKSPSR